jgi:hypothetical protein
MSLSNALNFHSLFVCEKAGIRCEKLIYCHKIMPTHLLFFVVSPVTHSDAVQYQLQMPDHIAVSYF